MEKKSLISTLKTTKKAHVAAAPATNEGSTSRKALARKVNASRMRRLAKAR